MLDKWRCVHTLSIAARAGRGRADFGGPGKATRIGQSAMRRVDLRKKKHWDIANAKRVAFTEKMSMAERSAFLK